MMLSTVRGNPCALARPGSETRASRSAMRNMATLRRLRAGLMCGPLAACTTRERPLRLGTTYTVGQSGARAVLDSLAPPTPAVGVGPSGQILPAAPRGG